MPYPGAVPFRSWLGTRAGAATASLLLIGFIAAGLWIHRLEYTRPPRQLGGPQVDTYLYFYPTAVFVHDELRSGRLPLWNPYQMAGQPTLALHVPAVLYPPNLLLLAALPPRLAMPALAVLHVFLAGCFTWLFAGRLGLGAAARLAAALALMLCPTLLLGLYMPPFLATPAWLPAVLWSIHGLASEARPRWALALGASLGLSFLGGHAQAFVYVVQVSALYGVFALAFVATSGQRGRVSVLAGAGGVVALAISAPQLLPALELARDGVRGLDGLTLSQAGFSPTTRPMLPRGLLGAFAPRWVMSNALQPVLLLPLALCGVLARGRRAHWAFFLVLCGLLAYFMTGTRSPVFRFYYELPLGDLFRLPSRAGFVYGLAGALLLAIGVDLLVRQLAATRAPAWVAGALGLVLAAGVGADRYARTDRLSAHPVLERPLPAAPPAFLDFLRERPRRDRVVVEETNLGIRMLRKWGSIYGIPMIPDYEPNMPGDYARFLGVGGNSVWHGNLRDPRVWAPLAGRLDLMSARFYALARPAPVSPAAKLLAGGKAQELDGVTVIRRPNALPRLYSVRRARSVPDLDAALRELDAEDFDPRSEAVLIGPAGVVPPPPDARRMRADEVSLDEVSPRRVAARADCAARCLIVLTDLHHPDWRLRVDGADRPIERVNGIFRGVWLEPGKHSVVYFYRPTTFHAGLAILGATTLLLGGCVAYSVRRRRRGP